MIAYQNLSHRFQEHHGTTGRNNYGHAPSNEGGWPLSMIENAASCRCQEEMNNSTEGTQELEEMLDDERVAVEV